MKPGLISILEGADGIVSVQGALLLVTVEEALRQSGEIFKGHEGDAIIDLAGVNRADSAGLALLIHWVRELRTSGRYLSYIHTPTHLLKLAQASDLENILPFAPAAAANLS